MATMRETAPGVFEPIAGNPTLKSLDGTMKAPLRTILATSWTAEDRAKFGIYVVQEMAADAGKRVTARRYERQGDAVVEVLDVEDEPRREPEPDYIAMLLDLKARVEALEGKK